MESAGINQSAIADILGERCADPAALFRPRQVNILAIKEPQRFTGILERTVDPDPALHGGTDHPAFLLQGDDDGPIRSACAGMDVRIGKFGQKPAAIAELDRKSTRLNSSH